MDERFNALSAYFLNKPFSDCTEDELQQFVTQYPYLAPAHFLYLKKLHVGSAAYQQQYQRAALYFSNPLLFESFIQDQQHMPLKPALAETEKPVLEEPALLVEMKTGSVETKEEKPLPVPKAADVTGLSFEPYHTVDYFASQGIKISLDEMPKDKFGKQLKSFTEWLKTMKRISPADAAASESATVNKVDNLAAHSVVNADVVTESMAEVWLMQGNRQKARETYEKLSLQNPSKRAYFAAKIQNIKE